MNRFLLILGMNKKIALILCFLVIFYPGCKSKEEKKESYFPVLSFLKSQVAHVDTSLYKITKLVSIDSTWDTSYIKREEFRTYASDFLEGPDLADKSYEPAYEESKFFDASLNRVIITYTPKKDRTLQPIQREEVTIEPGDQGNDKVRNIIVDKQTTSKDSVTLIKRMLWTVDESFQITTIIQKPGMPDSIQTTRINWE